MKIIDAHIHLSNLATFKQTARHLSKLNYTSQGLLEEFKECDVVLGIGMGLTETKKDHFPDPSSPTPMGLDLEANLPRNIAYCPGINPFKLDQQNLHHLESLLNRPEVVGIKIYLGYYPFYAYDEMYDPVYALAKKYELPIVFHTGDTYSERALLKYSHPLTLDEVAVKHREINFMMAHMGDPWILDAAEVLYKNRNMYADLSGLIVGDEKDVVRQSQKPLVFDHLKHALAYLDQYSKLLFGTDWPLSPIKPYVNWMKEIIPVQHHKDFFYNNALKVFPKIKKLIDEEQSTQSA